MRIFKMTMLNYEDIPKNIVSILEDIKRLHPGCPCVLAGGALRDLVTDKPINDLDIFIYDPKDTRKCINVGILKLKPVINNCYVPPDERKGRISRAYKSNRSATEKVYKGYEVNLVYMPEHFTAEDLIADFDFGICQIAFDGSNVIYTDAFESDIKNQTLTVISNSHTRKKHTKKMQKKFPEYTLIDDYEKLYKLTGV